MSKEILNLHLDDIRVHAPTGGAAGQVPALNGTGTALIWQNGFNGFTMMPSSFTASSNGTTNCPIGIPTYDYTSDYLMVVYLNQYMISGVEYSLNANHTSIDLIGFSLSAGETVYFQVLKSIVSVPQSTFNGNLITAGTVPNSAMIYQPGWTKLAEVTLGSTASQVNINIPTGYKELELSLFMKSVSGTYIYLRFNGNTANYAHTQIVSNNDTYAYQGRTTSDSSIPLYNHRVTTDYSMAPAGSSAGFAKFNISNHIGSYKGILARFRGASSATSITEGSWYDTTEISQLNIVGTSFTAGSTIVVRGSN